MEFRFLGTKIYISFLFAALICFMIALDRTGLIIPLICAIVLHESAHLITMWAVGCQPKAVRLIPASVQITRGFSLKKHGEALIAAAGPAINLLIGIVFLADYSFCKGEGVLRISLINFCVAGFNLLPVYGLDGGTLLACFLTRKSADPFKGERIVRIISLFLGAAFFGCGVFFCLNGNTNLSFFAVSIYLILGAVIKM